MTFPRRHWAKIFILKYNSYLLQYIGTQLCSLPFYVNCKIALLGRNAQEHPYLQHYPPSTVEDEGNSLFHRFKKDREEFYTFSSPSMTTLKAPSIKDEDSNNVNFKNLENYFQQISMRISYRFRKIEAALGSSTYNNSGSLKAIATYVVCSYTTTKSLTYGIKCRLRIRSQLFTTYLF